MVKGLSISAKTASPNQHVALKAIVRTRSVALPRIGLGAGVTGGSAGPAGSDSPCPAVGWSALSENWTYFLWEV